MSTQHEPPFDTSAYQNYLETMKTSSLPNVSFNHPKLKEAQQLCKDLEEAVLEERSLLEHIIDEYVHNLSDNEIRGYQREVKRILGE